MKIYGGGKFFIIAVMLATVIISTGPLISVGATTAAQEKDRPLIIKSRRGMDIVAIYRCTDTQRRVGLTVQVNVTFESTGKISHTEIETSSGCDSYDREALRIGKKVKFKPAIKGGKPITVTRPVEYSYREF